MRELKKDKKRTKKEKNFRKKQVMVKFIQGGKMRNLIKNIVDTFGIAIPIAFTYSHQFNSYCLHLCAFFIPS